MDAELHEAKCEYMYAFPDRSSWYAEDSSSVPTIGRQVEHRMQVLSFEIQKYVDDMRAFSTLKKNTRKE